MTSESDSINEVKMFILGVIIGTFLSVPIAMFCALSDKNREWKDEIIEKKYAEFKYDETIGKSIFIWKDNGEKVESYSFCSR